MKSLRNFLLSPEKEKDNFGENDVLIWIDWREEEESIIKYFNEKLPDKDKIQFECIETEKERGIDIILKKNNSYEIIPYDDNFTDRDTTLKSIQKYLEPKYQIRWYLDSLGGDTLAFCIFLSEQWRQLEKEFGKDKVEYYFAPIQQDSVMFEMDMNEVFALLEQRGDA